MRHRAKVKVSEAVNNIEKNYSYFYCRLLGTLRTIYIYCIFIYNYVHTTTPSPSSPLRRDNLSHSNSLFLLFIFLMTYLNTRSLIPPCTLHAHTQKENICHNIFQVCILQKGTGLDNFLFIGNYLVLTRTDSLNIIMINII